MVKLHACRVGRVVGLERHIHAAASGQVATGGDGAVKRDTEATTMSTFTVTHSTLKDRRVRASAVANSVATGSVGRGTRQKEQQPTSQSVSQADQQA